MPSIFFMMASALGQRRVSGTPVVGYFEFYECNQKPTMVPTIPYAQCLSLGPYFVSVIMNRAVHRRMRLIIIGIHDPMLEAEKLSGTGNGGEALRGRSTGECSEGGCQEYSSSEVFL